MISINGRKKNAELIRNYLIDLANNDKLWLAVGSGQDSWDSNLPDINSNITKLVNEVKRVKVESSDIVFVKSGTNPDEDVVTDSVETKIRILGNIVCPMTPLREYGLFIEGSETAESGTLYSYCRHSKVVLGQLHLYLKYVYINF